MSPKIFLTLGAVNAFFCVALGAFGAHGLKQTLSADMLAVYQTGVQYHFYHALGLIAENRTIPAHISHPDNATHLEAGN